MPQQDLCQFRRRDRIVSLALNTRGSALHVGALRVETQTTARRFSGLRSKEREMRLLSQRCLTHVIKFRGCADNCGIN